MFLQSLHGLWYGFGIALEPHNLMWSVFGVLLGNLIGVLPGMGPLSAISILLPLTFAMHPVPAILMLAGIFYGSMYGGVIGAVLLNIPTHPSHAVTCLDGYPLTTQGKGAKTLGLAMLSGFFAASTGILLMIFFSPALAEAALDFGAPEIFAIMLLGLLAGSTLSGGSALKGVAMTLIGMIAGVVGTDVNTGMTRFAFGISQLDDGLGLVSLALGIFAVRDFLLNVNKMKFVTSSASVRVRDMLPNWSDIKQVFFPILRGTAVGSAFGAMPGSGPAITSFVGYALEQKVSRTPERFGKGAIEGVVASEAATHSKAQVDFIPTFVIGIPGDATMALILGALMIQGISPGPQLISEHPDVFWGLIASFWIGNVILLVLNMPLISLWINLLRVPYRFLYPAALFFIAIGAFSTNNDLFEILEVITFSVVAALFVTLEFPMAPVLLGFILGPMVEENFRRAVLISRGNLAVFVERPISAVFVALSCLLISYQFISYRRKISAERAMPQPGLSAKT